MKYLVVLLAVVTGEITRKCCSNNIRSDFENRLDMKICPRLSSSDSSRTPSLLRDCTISSDKLTPSGNIWCRSSTNETLTILERVYQKLRISEDSMRYNIRIIDA